MDPYYLKYLEAGARDILSKPCVPSLEDPITRHPKLKNEIPGTRSSHSDSVPC